MKLNKRFFLLISALFLMIFTISCEYIIELPEPPAQNIKKTGNLKTFSQIEEAAKDPNNLNVLFISGPEAEAAREISDEFQDITGMKVTVFDAEWKDLKELILYGTAGTRIGSGTIDIIEYPSYFVGKLSNFITDLSDYIIEDNYLIDDFLPNVFDTAKWGDLVKGIPIQSSLFCIIYRADLFLENDLSIENDWKFEDYYSYMKLLNSDDSKGILFDPSKSNLNIYWSNRFWSLGGITLTEDFEPNINNPIGIESIDLLKEMLNYTDKNIMEKDYNEVVLEFMNGVASMFEGSPKFLFGADNDLLNSEIISKLGILPSPSGDKGHFVQLNTNLIGIAKDSIKKEMAWKWIKLFSSPEKSNLFLDKFAILSPRISTYTNTELINKYKFLKDIYDIYLFEESSMKNRWRVSASYDAWEIELNNKLFEVLTENISSQQAIKDLEKSWERILLLKPISPGEKIDG